MTLKLFAGKGSKRRRIWVGGLLGLAVVLAALVGGAGRVSASHIDIAAGANPSCPNPTTRYTRVNSQTIQVGCNYFYTDSLTGGVLDPGYVDPATGATKGVVFSFLNTKPVNGCRAYVYYDDGLINNPFAQDAAISKAVGWQLAEQASDGSSCTTFSAKGIGDIANNAAGGKVRFFKNAGGSWESVRLSNASPFALVPPPAGGSWPGANGANVYMEQKPPQDCPAILIFEPGRPPAYFAPSKGQPVAGEDSGTYRQILRAASGGADNPNCIAPAGNGGALRDNLKGIFLVPNDRSYVTGDTRYGTIPFQQNSQPIQLDPKDKNWPNGVVLLSGNMFNEQWLAAGGPALDRPTYLAAAKNGNNSQPGSGPTCSAGALGWIICPLLSIVTGANDAMYAVIENLLKVPPVNMDFSSNKNGAYIAWNAVRSIANVVFVIAFLFMVFSQATSVGLSSYGFKKMLPRLLAGAVLVNISYFLAAFAVDVFNLIGAGMTNLLEQATAAATVKGAAINWGDVLGGIIGGTFIVGAGLAAGAAALWTAGGMVPLLLLLLAAAIPAFLAIVTALLTLVARQAILVILIVISPLAFAAYLLPNTEKYFDRWRGLFVNMLMLYPLAALVFGGSKLAAQIIMSVAQDPSYGGIGPIPANLIALVIISLPLFALPFLMRAGGGILGKIGAVVNNPNRGPIDGLRKRFREGAQSRAESKRAGWAAQSRENGASGYSALRGWVAGGRRRRESRLASNKTEAELKYASYLASLGTDPSAAGERFRRRMAGAGGADGEARVAARASATQNKLNEEELATISGQYARDNTSVGQLKQYAKQTSGTIEIAGVRVPASEVTAKAAVDRLVQMHMYDQIEELATGGQLSAEVSRHFATRVGENFADARASNMHLTNAEYMQKLHAGEVKPADKTNALVAELKNATPELLATQKPGEILDLAAAATLFDVNTRQPLVDPNARADIKLQIEKLKTEDQARYGRMNQDQRSALKHLDDAL